MYECGRKIYKKYPPSKNFTDKLSEMTEKWAKFVDSIRKFLGLVHVLIREVPVLPIIVEPLYCGHHWDMSKCPD